MLMFSQEHLTMETFFTILFLTFNEGAADCTKNPTSSTFHLRITILTYYSNSL